MFVKTGVDKACQKLLSCSAISAFGGGDFVAR